MDNNSIIGVWKLIATVDVCVDGTESVRTFNSCEQKGRITFFENGSVRNIGYSDHNGDCEMRYDQNGDWTMGNNSLTISWDYGEVDKLTIFELSNNTLNLGYYDTDANCNSGKGSHWYVTAKRVN